MNDSEHITLFLVELFMQLRKSVSMHNNIVWN